MEPTRRKLVWIEDFLGLGLLRKRMGVQAFRAARWRIY